MVANQWQSVANAARPKRRESSRNRCLLSALFLVVEVAEMAWNLEIENKLAKQIESFVG